MASYQIPEHHVIGFLTLVKLSNEKTNKLINSLENSSKGLRPEELSKSISGNVNINKQDLNQIIEILFSLYGLKYRREGSTEVLIKDICDSLKETVTFSKQKGINWEIFKDKLSKLLSLDKSIGLTVKTLGLGGEYEKIYVSSRIITDIRPAFLNLNEHVETGLIVHNLKIEYHIGNRHEEIFIAFDSSDLKELKDYIIRAEKKEELIKSSLGKKIFFISTIKK